MIGYLDKLPANAKVKKLVRVGYRALSCAACEPVPDLGNYCERPHVLVTFAGDLIGYVDETLSRQGHQRDIVLSVSTFSMLPFVLPQTNLVATVPEHVSHALARAGALRPSDLPFSSPQFDLSMAWRLPADRDPAEEALRQIIQDVVISHF